MPHLEFGWQVAFQLAAALLGVAALARLAALRVAPLVWAARALGQSAVMVALFGLWGLIGSHTTQQVIGATARGQAIWDAERRWHVPSEAWVQSLMLPHRELTQAANAYYVYGHFNPLMGLLAWVWIRHRADYLRVCIVLIAFTASATLLQLLAVAPPRLLPGHLVVDTPEVYGQSVYGPQGLGDVSHLSAMPSIHCGWAMLFGLFAVTLSTSRWRWLALAHPVLMFVVVAVTGNHYWADGAVSAGLLLVSYVIVSGGFRLARSPGRCDQPGQPGQPGQTGVPDTDSPAVRRPPAVRTLEV